MEEKLPHLSKPTIMKNFSKVLLAAALVIGGLGVATPEAKADNMSCYGSSSYQSCTYTTWEDGQYITCYGSITKYSENWNCY